MPSCDGSNCGACSTTTVYKDTKSTAKRLKALEESLNAELKKNKRLEIALDEILKRKKKPKRTILKRS